MASVEEIDELNILQATLLAMQRAVNGLAIQPDEFNRRKLPPQITYSCSGHY